MFIIIICMFGWNVFKIVLNSERYELFYILYSFRWRCLHPQSDLDWRIHGEPWYDSLSCFFSSKFGRVLLLDVEKCVLDLYSILTVLKVACCRVCFYVIEWSMFIAVLLLIVCLLVLIWHQRKIELLLHPSSLACLNSSLIVYSCPPWAILALAPPSTDVAQNIAASMAASLFSTLQHVDPARAPSNSPVKLSIIASMC